MRALYPVSLIWHKGVIFLTWLIVILQCADPPSSSHFCLWQAVRLKAENVELRRKAKNAAFERVSMDDGV
jgi:hypothetical protein